MEWTKYLVALFVFFTIAYWYLKRIHCHWKKQNVPFVPDPIPIFGHMWPAISIKENIADFVDRAYQNFNSSMIGFFFMQQPGVIVRDPDLVKSVLQTNFSSFDSNVLPLSEKHDPILGKNPFFTGQRNLWKVRRSGASSNLTGKKLKSLFFIIEQVSEKMNKFIDRKISENNGSFECELKKVFVKYTGEVVANAAFAIEGQNFEDNPDELSFAKVVVTLFEPSFINGMKQTLHFYLPSIGNFFGLSMLEKSTDSFMRENIKAILKQRQQTGDTPNDYLQFCTESNSDLDGILGSIVNFYMDVYETSSTVIADLFYCLSENQEIQMKLRDHIKSVIEENEDKITYDSLKNMTYLDQVLQESLRHFPAFAVLMKRCNEAITLTGSDGLKCHFEPGNPVFIPVDSLHHDENYWSDPKVFDPERFSVENQANINKYTFLGFGEGPRMCVGMGLSLLVVKLAVVTLILNFSIESSSKTNIPLEMEPSTLLTSYKGGLWGRFEKLN